MVSSKDLWLDCLLLSVWLSGLENNGMAYRSRYVYTLTHIHIAMSQ